MVGWGVLDLLPSREISRIHCVRHEAWGKPPSQESTAEESPISKRDAELLLIPGGSVRDDAYSLPIFPTLSTNNKTKTTRGPVPRHTTNCLGSKEVCMCLCVCSNKAPQERLHPPRSYSDRDRLVDCGIHSVPT